MSFLMHTVFPRRALIHEKLLCHIPARGASTGCGRLKWLRSITSLPQTPLAATQGVKIRLTGVAVTQPYAAFILFIIHRFASLSDQEQQERYEFIQRSLLEIYEA